MRTILVAAVALVASSLVISAQSVSVNRIEISSDAARRMVEACLAWADKNKVAVGVAVVGIDGVLIDFHLLQGAAATNSETAILKARTAAHWRRPTRELEEWMRTGSNAAPEWIGDFPRAGGVPIVIGGQVAGAIGVGGGGARERLNASCQIAFRQNGSCPYSSRSTSSPRSRIQVSEVSRAHSRRRRSNRNNG